MRSAVFKGKHKMEVLDWETKNLDPHDVRIRVESCGICGTDQHIYHGHPGSAAVNPPIVLGHELAGEVIEVGAKVSNLKLGDRVSIDPNIYCGECEYCRSGRPHLCDHLQAIGVTRDGGMAEYCIVPAINAYRIPNEMSYVEGAMVEPVGCVLHGLKKIDVRPVHTVLIIGGGFIGQLFLQLIKKQGAAKIIVSESVVEKHDRLVQLGANEVVQPTNPETVQHLMNSADVVIECAGRKESIELAIQAARKGGQILLFGVSSPDTVINVSPFAIFSNELSIKGSFINPYTHDEAISLIRQNMVRIEPLISHYFSLDDIPEVMGKYPQMNVAKGVVTMGGYPQTNVAKDVVTHSL